MPETQQFAEQFKADASAPFPVLTDLDNGYALSLNLAIWLGTEIQRLLAYQDMSSFHGNDGWVLPIPATFVVGRDGLVKARFVDPDFRKRMEIDDLIAALKSARANEALSSPILQSRYGLLADELLPVRAAQHPHHGGSHGGPLAPGDAVEVHGAARVEPFDGGALQRRRDRRGVGDDGDADIGFEQLDQVALRGDLVAALDVEPMLAQRSVHPVGNVSQ